jgi:hypothetical protein
MTQKRFVHAQSKRPFTWPVPFFFLATAMAGRAEQQKMGLIMHEPRDDVSS